MSEYDVRMSGPTIAHGDVEFFRPPEEVTTEGFRKMRGEPLSLVRTMEPDSFLLDALQFEELADMSTGGEFVEVGEFGQGRHKSAHGLVFGQLIMSSLFEVEKQVHIAVKPFDTPKDAVREYLISRYINGFNRDGDGQLSHGHRTLTFNPLGFHYFLKGGEYGLVTEYDPTVISFDNTFWDAERTPTDEQVQRALSRSAMGLARLHIFGLSHGDASIKNMAADNEGFRFIDLEKARPLPRSGEEIDILGAKTDMKKDVATLMSSLNSGIDDEPRDYTEQVTEAFYEQYLAAIQHPSSTIPEAARLKKEDIDKMVEDNLY